MCTGLKPNIYPKLQYGFYGRYIYLCSCVWLRRRLKSSLAKTKDLKKLFQFNGILKINLSNKFLNFQKSIKFK